MRNLLCIVGAACLLAAPGARAQDVKAVVDKAVKAHGGADNLAKYKATTSKAKGKFYGFGDGIEFTNESAMQQPDKLRSEIAGEAGGQQFKFVTVVNGNKGWRKMGDDANEMNEDQLADAKQGTYVNRLISLVMLKDAGFTLAPLGESKVGDKAAVGLKVSHAGQKDVNLYFDKDSGLLLKSETQVKDMMSGQDARQEVLYQNYKAVNGLQKPFRIEIKRDGNKYLETDFSEIKVAESLPEATFAKP